MNKINYINYFDICAVPILLIAVFTTMLRRMTKGRANKLYFLSSVMALIAVVCELLENLAYLREPPYSADSILYAKIMDYIYFAVRNGTTVAYFFFVVAMTKTWFRVKPLWKRICIVSPYCAMLVLLATNEMHGLVFTVTAESGYQRGSCIMFLYVTAYLYMLIGVLYLVVHKYTLDLGEWIALLSMYFVNVASVGLQYFYPEYLVESFATSLSLLFIVIYVQRPERLVDMSTGLPGYRAFCREMEKIKATGQDVQLVIVTLRNAAEMHKYLKEAFLTYLQRVYGQITLYAKEERIGCEIYLEQPGTFYILLDNAEYNPVQAIPELRERIRQNGNKLAEQGALPDICIVTVHFPKEISDPEELLWFGHNYSRFADYSRVFCRAETVLANRSYQIEAHLDEILNRAVSTGSVQIRYLPMHAVKEDAFSSAKAVVMLTDEVYGSIDPELLMNAAEERGLSVRVGSRVMEEVFSFAGSSAMERLHYCRIHVSLSVAQCMQMNLTDTVWKLREKYRTNPARIAFDIRESSYENMSSVFNENLKKLSAQGYRIVLDGFGRGYTNMQHLLAMPVQAVRIDRSVVAAASSEGGRAVLKGIVDMMKRLPREVIAEGADDRETADMLIEMGCDIIEGQYYTDMTETDEIQVEAVSENG